MKLSKKLIAVAVAAAAIVSATFTSCEGFGKDDFFGTWCASYTVTPDNLAEGTGYTWSNVKNFPNVKVYMYFDGKSEDLVKSGGAKFYQYKIRYNDSGSVGMRSFWCGTYKLTDNSKYTEGKLHLDYLYGGHIVEGNLEGAIDAALSSNQSSVISYLKTSPAPTSNTSGTDLEIFDFSLGGASLFTGYREMSATARQNCTWEVLTRSFELQGSDSNVDYLLTSLSGDGSATEHMNIVSAPASSLTAEK